MVPYYLRIFYGTPVVALAAAGAMWFRRRQQRDRLSLTLSGWSVGCLAFLVLGVATPVDMRYYLAYFPAVAMLAAIGASWLWRGGTVHRALAIGLLGWAVLVGVAEWLRPLTGWSLT
jgi:hypothetical protein